MAVPTISAVSPDTSLFLGGQVVEITGTNFSVPEDAFGFDYDPSDVNQEFTKVPANNPVWPTPDPVRLCRVQLVVGGNTYTISNAKVTSSTRIWFNMPRILASANTNRSINYTESADIVVTNLDSNGDPIPGESVTLEDAIEFQMPRTGASATEKNTSLHTRITASVIEHFRSFVHPNTVSIPHKDYLPSPVKVVPQVKQLPAIVVIGPDGVRSRLKSHTNRRVLIEEVATGKTLDLGSTQVEDLVYDIFLLDHSLEHLLDLKGNLQKWFNSTPYFSYRLYDTDEVDAVWTSLLVWDRIPGVDNAPTHLHDSIRQVKARLRITSVPSGLSANYLRDIRERLVESSSSSIIFQSSESATDSPPDSAPGILEE